MKQLIINYSLKTVIVFLTITLFACNSSGTSSNSLGNNSTVLGTLPNGSIVYMNESIVNVVNQENSSLNLSIANGQPGFNYTFTFSVIPNTPSITPSSCSLTSGSTVNSCNLTVLPNFTTNGSYFITVYYTLNSTTQSLNSIKSLDMDNNSLQNTIPIQVSGDTIAEIIYPTNTESVGVGTQIIARFNNPIESNTVNKASFLLYSDSGESISAVNISTSPDNESATFIVTSSYESALKLDTKYIVQLTSDILDYNQKPIIESTFTFKTQTRPLRIFLTESSYNGNLLAAANILKPGSAINGIEAADYICQNDTHRPNNSTYKAMIVDSQGKYRSAYPTPVDWVFAPYTKYSNSVESTSFITGINPPNGNPFIVAVSSTTFNAYSQSVIGTDLALFLTGLSTNWTTIPDKTCLSWSSSDAELLQSYGFLASNAGAYAQLITIGSSYEFCQSSGFSLMCIEH